MKRTTLSLSTIAAIGLTAMVGMSAPASAGNFSITITPQQHHCGHPYQSLSKRQVFHLMHDRGFRNIRKIKCRYGFYLVKGKGYFTWNGWFKPHHWKRWVDPYTGKVFFQRPIHSFSQNNW